MFTTVEIITYLLIVSYSRFHRGELSVKDNKRGDRGVNFYQLIPTCSIMHIINRFRILLRGQSVLDRCSTPTWPPGADVTVVLLTKA